MYGNCTLFVAERGLQKAELGQNHRAVVDLSLEASCNIEGA